MLGEADIGTYGVPTGIDMGCPLDTGKESIPPLAGCEEKPIYAVSISRITIGEGVSVG